MSKCDITLKFNYSRLNYHKYDKKFTNFNYFILFYKKLPQDFKIFFINKCLESIFNCF